MKFEHTSGGFTLPGESGQEKLTLELAKKWGADVIRDSDGTQFPMKFSTPGTIFTPPSASSVTTMPGQRNTRNVYSSPF